MLPCSQSGSFVPLVHLLHPLKLSHVALEGHFVQSGKCVYCICMYGGYVVIQQASVIML